FLGVDRNHVFLEPHATDTSTNASFSAEILKSHSPSRVVLVTSAIHIPRSVIAFNKAGVEVIPAPVDYAGGNSSKLLPSSSAIQRTARITHEILGRFEP
ncbi:MAG: YdcF family protein, partial [Polyangiaceae bacterium]|nr:YdcF family protein [Polyangiaceae bacterium]